MKKFKIYEEKEHIEFLDYGEKVSGIIERVIKVEEDGSAYYRVRFDNSTCVSIISTDVIIGVIEEEENPILKALAGHIVAVYKMDGMSSPEYTALRDFANIAIEDEDEREAFWKNVKSAISEM